MTDVSVSLRAKRKRGRPRKDSNLCTEGSFRSPENSAFLRTQRLAVMHPTLDAIRRTQDIDKNSKDGTVDSMVGSMVYGVVEGSFDAGYLISVRIGNNQTPYRGLVFQPRKFVPVSATNDIAPQVKMYHRSEIPVPVYDNQSQTCGFSPHPDTERATLQPVQALKQAVLRPILPSMPLRTPYSSSNHSSFVVPEAMTMRTSSCSNMGGNITTPVSPNSGVCKQFSYVHPTGSLRMVEEDEVMQAFEVLTSSGGCKNNIATSGDMMSETLESFNQQLPVHGKAVESAIGRSVLTPSKPQGSDLNVQLHHNPMEYVPRSAFETRQDEITCREKEHPGGFVHSGLPNPTIELQENHLVAQGHSVTREPQAKTEQQLTSLYYNELRSSDVNFHQNSLAAQFHPGDLADSVSKSPNLKLDLAFTVNENTPKPPEPQANAVCLETNYSVLNGMKTPNLGYHQALVAGNPLFLPPDLSSEPLEFMIEKPKAPPNCRTPLETNLELEHRPVEAGQRSHGPDAMSNAEAAASPSASY